MTGPRSSNSQLTGTGAPLRVRWLGKVPYRQAWAVQRGYQRRAFESPGVADRLLMLEHEHVYTLGRSADAGHILVDADSVGAEVVEADRGGDVTYHGPGQLVAYPLVELPDSHGRVAAIGGLPDTRSFVALLETAVINTLTDLGLPNVGRQSEYPGVWVDPGTPEARKIAAVGVRVERGRTLHGMALNVDPDMAMFQHIVPCGITEFGVTSLAQELAIAPRMKLVSETFADHFARLWRPSSTERSDVVWRDKFDLANGDADLTPFSRGFGAGDPTDGSNLGVAKRKASSHSNGAKSDAGTSVRLLGRLAEAGVESGIEITERKPDWMRSPLKLDTSVLKTKKTVADLNLVTVCEEAGCPNLSECWSDGTATFMVNGERCTRACGFCLVDTRKPEPPDPTEPARVAEAVNRMGLDFAVITTVARDDLPDEGAGHIADTIRAIHSDSPEVSVEVLISDCRGRAEALNLIFAAKPNVVNHNIETVARLQRAVRPSASYATSLSVLARSVDAGFVTKSGLVLGMGETRDEVDATLADLAEIGVSIVTIGQYLRPTTNHLPVAHWWHPDEFDRFAEVGRSLGIAHVESSPFTRSSYHAKAAAGDLA